MSLNTFAATDRAAIASWLTPPCPAWVRMSFVQSLDGHVTGADGLSRSLGGQGDRQILRALRAHADCIVVGHITAAAERYDVPRLPDPAMSAGTDRPHLVILTRSGNLDTSIPALQKPAQVTVLTTPHGRAHPALHDLEQRGVQITALDGALDPDDVVTHVRQMFGERVLCEGGPTIAAAWFAAGVVDELCLTIAPTLLGGDPQSMLSSGLAQPQDLVFSDAVRIGSDVATRWLHPRHAADGRLQA